MATKSALCACVVAPLTIATAILAACGDSGSASPIGDTRAFAMQ